jgi:hypothetical protein
MPVEILFRDGFDHYNNQTDFQAVYTVDAFRGFVAGRTDGLAFYGGFYLGNFGSLADLTVSVAANPAGSLPVIQMMDSATNEPLLRADFSNSNVVMITANRSTTNYNIPIIPVGSWSHIAVRVITGAGGSVEIILNGNNVILPSTPLNIQTPDGVTQINKVAWLSTADNCYYDDLVVATGGFPGDLHIHTDFPVSDVALTMTPLSGTSGYAMVDEVAMDSDTSYVSASAVGQEIMCGFTPITLTPGSTVVELSMVSATRKTDGGTSTYTHQVTQGSTTASGVPAPQGTSYGYSTDSFGANDPTGAAWTAATINSASYGGVRSA